MTTWTKHGESAQTSLLAGIMPRSSIHFLTGPEKSGRTSIAADIAVAIAAGDVGCGLSAPDKSGVRTSLAGVFGHATGAPAGVAIITEERNVGAIGNAIHAAALERLWCREHSVKSDLTVVRAAESRAPNPSPTTLSARRSATVGGAGYMART